MNVEDVCSSETSVYIRKSTRRHAPTYLNTWSVCCTRLLSNHFTFQCTGVNYVTSVAYPEILFGGGGVSTNSVENRGQRERGPVGGSQGFWR